MSITAANVAIVASTTPNIVRGKYAGATITAGQALYADATGKMFPAINSGTALQATLAGIALHASLTGQPIEFLSQGPITIGATVVLGQTYVVSTNAGGVAPISDLISTEYVSIIGIATSVTVINVTPLISGVQHA